MYRNHHQRWVLEHICGCYGHCEAVAGGRHHQYSCRDYYGGCKALRHHLIHTADDEPGANHSYGHGQLGGHIRGNGYVFQRLCGSSASATYTPPVGTTICDGLRTESQATWGQMSNGSTNPAAYMTAYFGWLYTSPDYLTIEGSGSK
ncbi:MAG: hypothetical protein IPO17_04270 [Flavobacteriales bacterium]|nr:hypothetical protein [Flavobacteriales bacterium]